jgi:hypothetical protein
LDKAIQQATKLLGGKGKIPQPSRQIDASRDAFAKAWDPCIQAVKALDDALGVYWRALDAYGQIIQKDNFGLDLRDSDDKDKIKQARAVIMKPIDEAMGQMRPEDQAIKGMQRSLDRRRDG